MDVLAQGQMYQLASLLLLRLSRQVDVGQVADGPVNRRLASCWDA